MKRLLVISADPISQTYNNGKTIETMIGKWSAESIAQLFSNAYLPSSMVCSNFYRITDKDMVNRIIRHEDAGSIVENANVSDSIYIESSIRGNLKTVPLARLLREMLWLTDWKCNQKLNRWLESFSPEVILFVGGDLIFMYSLCEYIRTKFAIPVIFQVTDDYLDRSCGYSLAAMIKKKWINSTFRSMLNTSSGFITIGSYMRDTYREKFGKDSTIFMNAIPVPDQLPKVRNGVHDDTVQLIYAGSLYFGRENVLLTLRNAIEKVSTQGVKIQLSIYTSSAISAEKRALLDDGVYSRICGYVTQEELQQKIRESDILVFVEDFSEESRKKTRLSVSTKLPEYMASGRAILAIGPNDVGSMKYAEEFAMVCNSPEEEEIERCLLILSSDDVFRAELVDRAYQLMVARHSLDRNKTVFYDMVEEVCQKWHYLK